MEGPEIMASADGFCASCWLCVVCIACGLTPGVQGIVATVALNDCA